MIPQGKTGELVERIPMKTFHVIAVVIAFVASSTRSVLAEPPLHGLSAPYTDSRNLTAVPFGAHSHWLQPWRAYSETVPAQRFLDAQGVVLNGNSGDNFDLVCAMLAKHGIRHARIEVGWGSVTWEDESRLNGVDELRARLAACRKNGIRPLILLNANSGAPCPTRFFDRVLAAPGRKGDRNVRLSDTAGLVPGYSGFRNLTDNRASEVLITAIDGDRVTLSKPLPKDLGDAGVKIAMTTLKYRPFGPPDSAEYRATLDGWRRYVVTVARTATEILGTTGKSDLGFDMEIWNELSFGSSFLTVNAYYDPKLAAYDENAVWTAVVRATADVADAAPASFAGVRLVDGFRNTIPWPASTTEPTRITAMSAHPYAGKRTFPRDEQRPRDVNAELVEEHPGFVPSYTALFPEYYGTYIQTETVLRDMGPVSTPVGQTVHGRDARIVGGVVAPCPLWFTEIGFAPVEEGVKDRNAALALKAKTGARYDCFFVGKGLERIYFYSAFSGDTDLGVVQDNFIAYARTHTAYPTDDAALTSPMLRTIGRIAAVMRDGLDPALRQTRPIRVESVADRHDHSQFSGDGTPAHPTLYDRDVFAILPYQVNAHRFVLAYYVMTRDIMHSFVPENFTVRLGGVRGKGAALRAYDPISGRDIEVTRGVVTGETLTATVTATDSPCLLIIDEK
jgi:hypothetical protein